MRSLPLPALLTLVLPVLAAACGGGGGVGQTFQDLGGSGGNSTGSFGGMGGAGASGGSTTTSTTTTTTTSTTTTTTGTGGGGGGGGGAVCSNGDKEKEPNDTESGAQDLGSIPDSDSSGESISGVIAGAGDADWYKYFGKDDFGSVVDPTRELIANGFKLRICKFIQCAEAGVEPDFGSCPSGTTAEMSPGGRPGCCGTSGFELDLSCSSAFATDDSATVYLRIDSPEGEECAQYTINYHF